MKPTPANLKPNSAWARLPLFNRKNWSRFRFGEVDLLKYKLHTDQELFDKAYGYIRHGSIIDFTNQPSPPAAENW